MPLTDPWAWPDATRRRTRARTHAGIASAYPRNAVTPKRLTGPRPGGRARAAAAPGSVGSRRARNDATMLARLRLHAAIAPRIPSVGTCAGRGLCFPC